MQPLWSCPAALVAVVALLVHTSCASRLRRTDLQSRKQHGQRSTPWGYGDDGGKAWPNLVGYAECREPGQSPADVSKMQGGAPLDGSKVYYRYKAYESPVHVFNDGRLLSVTFMEWQASALGSLYLGQDYPTGVKKEYQLYQLVIHTPSEHTYGGQRVPLELQLYHLKKPQMFPDNQVPEADEDKNDHQVVVSVGYQVNADDDSEFLEALAAGELPKDAGHEGITNVKGMHRLDFGRVFKEKPDDGPNGPSTMFISYDGSQSTPPCQRNVRWLLRSTPLPVKPDTLQAFIDAASATEGARDAGGGNARTLQDVAGRVATFYQTQDVSNELTPQQEAEKQNPSGPVQTVAAGDSKSMDAVKEVAESPHHGAKQNEACAKEFPPNDPGAILCCFSVQDIDTNKDMIIKGNGMYQEKQKEIDENKKPMADATANQNEQCGKEEEAKEKVGNSGAGPSGLAAKAELGSQMKVCEEAKSQSTALSAHEDKLKEELGEIQGQIESSIQKAREILANLTENGDPCQTANVEAMPEKAAPIDETQAAVSAGKAFPRHMAPGNPEIIAGSDTGTIELQLAPGTSAKSLRKLEDSRDLRSVLKHPWV